LCRRYCNEHSRRNIENNRRISCRRINFRRENRAIFFSMHVMRGTCVVHRAQHPLFTRVTTSRCVSVGGPSFAFIWRKTMPASREELIGTFENITTEQAGVTKSQLTTEYNKYYISAFSSSFSRILHQFDEKGGKKEVKKIHSSM